MSDDFDRDDPDAEVVAGQEEDDDFEADFSEGDDEEVFVGEPESPTGPKPALDANDFEQNMLHADTAPGRVEYEHYAEFTKKAEDARARGDMASARLHTQRAESWKRDFDELGIDLKGGAEEELLEKTERGINRAQKMGADKLNNPKLHGDARQLIQYFNRKSDAKYVYLDATVLNESQKGLEKEHTRLTKLAKEASKGKDHFSKMKAQEYRSRAKSIKEEMKISGSDAFNGQDIVKIPLQCGGDTARSLYGQFGGDQKKILQYLIDTGNYLPYGSPHLKAHQEQARASRPQNENHLTGNIVESDGDFEIEIGTPSGWEY